MLKAQLPEHRARTLVHALPVHQAEAVHGQMARIDVLPHGQGGDEVQLLRDEANAVAVAVLRVREVHALSAQEDLAAIAPAEAEQHVHQRGFARAVFAQQRVDLPLLKVEGDAVQGNHAGKLLADVAHFQ